MVLDASTVLAVLYGEPGQKEIRARLRGADAVISAVNFSEVAAKLAEAPEGDSETSNEAPEGSSGGGMEPEEIREVVGALALEIHPFDEEAALAAGLLRAVTKDRGLSLGDRACVAHARKIGGVALTVDGAWQGLDGVEVIER